MKLGGTLAQIDDALEGRSLDVSTEVHPLDPMHKYSPALYAEAGHVGLRHVRLALLAAGRDDPASILDFGCLTGRVLRVLKAAYPEAELTAADIVDPGVQFCVETFGARGVLSDTDPWKIDLGGTFDLIWSGSVLTHVPHQAWPGFLSVFEKSLNPGGVVVFTAYGRSTAEDLRSGVNLLNMEPDQAKELLAELDEHGAGYQKTTYDGDCVVSLPWVCKQLERTSTLRLVLCTEHSWLGQDVIACVKSP